MVTKQLKDVVKRLEALKSPEKSDDFNAGVDAAVKVVNAVVQEAIDLERMRQLEDELAQLRAKYSQDSVNTPRRRGRKPKGTQE